MRFKRTNIPYNGRDKYQTYGGGHKIKKKSKVYNGVGLISLGGGWLVKPNIDDDDSRPNINSSATVKVPISNISVDSLAGSGCTIYIPIEGFADDEETQLWVGTLDDTPNRTYGISGTTTGLNVKEIQNNGTENPIVVLVFTSAITQDSGELQIPVYVNKATNIEYFGATVDSWRTVNEETRKIAKHILIYSWNIKSAGGGSGFVFDLSNENATVNADNNGNIYTASTATLECTATLYYDNLPISENVLYSVSTQATGVSINNLTGVLSFANNFSFSGMSCNVYVSVSYNHGDYTATKTMRITKVKDGANGASGVRRWIVANVNSLVEGIDGTITPSIVTAQVYKQTGNNLPEIDTATTIFYGYSPYHINPTLVMSSSGVLISNNWDYLILALRNGNSTTGEAYETETIPVISESSGPAIRGPISWSSSLARRFSNGIGELETDKEFIDTIRYNGNTYKCVVSYTQSIGDTWNDVSENWELDNSYSFTASRVDLDANESIEIRDSNTVKIVSGSTVIGGLDKDGMFFGSRISDAKIAITRQGTINSEYSNIEQQCICPAYTSKGELNTTKIAMMSNYKLDTVFVVKDLTAFGKSKDEQFWTFADMDTGVRCEDYEYIITISDKTPFSEDYYGYICFSRLEEPENEDEILFTGVVEDTAQRKNNIIYITLA